MNELKSHIKNVTEDVIKEIDDFIMNNDEKMKWLHCLKLPICEAEALIHKIIDSKTNTGSRVTHEFIIASLTTRYLFELSANISVMLNTQPESLRNERQEKWLRLKDLDIIGESYSMPINNAPDNTKKRLLKNEDKITKCKGVTQNRQQDSETSPYSVPVSDDKFLFEDPWGLTIRKKIELMPLGNPSRFLEQWKLYSHIAHASAFSLWPKWIEPVPVNDAIQAFSVLLKVVSDFLKLDFNMKEFIDNSFVLIYGASD